MLRVLQGASLVAKRVAQHISEEAARGKLVTPVRWEGVVQAAVAAAATARQPPPADAWSSTSNVDATSSSDASDAVAAADVSAAATAAASPLPEMTPAAAPSAPLPRPPPGGGEVLQRGAAAGQLEESPEAPVEAGKIPPGGPAAATERRQSKAVPTHAVTRALHIGGLGLGVSTISDRTRGSAADDADEPRARSLCARSLVEQLAAGAAASAVRRAVRGEPAGPLLATDANVERLASTLCRLRGAALKVGQMLSFNDADVLPPALRVAMERVRDGADWMPARQLEETLASELGDGWRSQLVDFEEVPVASASIGQVHRATLEDGRRVAIKVQYPGVAESIRSDLWSMKQLIGYTGIIPPGLYLDRVLHVAQRELLQE